MKKNLTKPVIAVLLGALTFSSCIGSFSLTNSVLNWNKRATDTKFVNEIIFVLISPAYAVCSVADLLVLNSNANGLYQVRMAMNDGLFYAFNK